MDCILSGTGVEAFSGCFITESIESNDNFISGGSGGIYKQTMMPGENVCLEVSEKHVRYDGNFDFSYYSRQAQPDTRLGAVPWTDTHVLNFIG